MDNLMEDGFGVVNDYFQHQKRRMWGFIWFSFILNEI
jgi:hypothetical protein